MRVRVVVLVLIALVAQFVCLNAQDLNGNFSPATVAASGLPKGQIIVKLRADFASTFETSMLAHNSFSALAASDQATSPFLSQYGAHSMSPLYPSIVQSKLQQNLSWGQLAERMRQRFAARASRFEGTFNPPDLSRTYVLKLSDVSPEHVQQVLAQLKADPRVEYAEEDQIMTIALTPNDPYFSSSGTWGQAYDDLWGIKKIGAPAAWDTVTGAGVVVAVVDSGLDLAHPDIAANVWTNTDEIPGNGIDDDGNGYIDDVNGWNFVSNTANPTDDHGHGSHVSGTIAAVGNNGIGVIGVAWQSKIMVAKGLNSAGSGASSWLANALVYAANNGADVINNSWGGGGSQSITDAVVYAHTLGAVVVAAAGNSAVDTSGFSPARIPEAIAVAATDSNDQLASFSNYGDKIDVAAPGVDILSLAGAGTYLGTKVGTLYTRASGTSMAAPHVSGVAALILSQHPTFTNEQVRQALRTSASDIGTPGFDTSFGYGRLNSTAAIAVASPLEVKITAPYTHAIVTQATTITGVARGTGFASYTLDYGAGALPTAWTTIQTGTSPVSGTLGTFNPGLLPDGTYVIRLRALDGGGNPYEDRISIVIKCAAIDYPYPVTALTAASSFKTGSSVQISGYATGPSFESFSIDWARGYAPTGGWQTTGITLTGGGTSPLQNQTLATWLTAAGMERDYYTIRLTVHRGGTTFESRVVVYMEPSLFSSDWPVYTPSISYASGVVPGTASGNPFLAWAGYSSPAYLLISSPSASTGVTVYLYGYAGLYQPSVGPIAGDPSDEIAVGSDSEFDFFRAPDGYPLTRKFLGSVYMGFYYAQSVLEDIDGDSQLETVALEQDTPGTGAIAYLHAWRSSGELNSSFPLQIPDQNSNLIWTQNRVLVGDVNGDGQKEFVVFEGTSASTFTPRLFSSSGSSLTWSAATLNGTPLQAALADLDSNGKLELVMIVNDPTQTYKSVHVLQPDGTERSGWPVSLLAVTQSGGPAPAYLAIGDLLGDGHNQIVVSDRTALFVFNANGTTFSGSWPLVPAVNAMGYKPTLGPVVIADIDGSGHRSILTTFLAPTENLLVTSSSTAARAQSANANSNTVSIVYSENPHREITSAPVNPQVVSTPLQLQMTLAVINNSASTVRSWNLQGEYTQQPCMNGVITVGDFDHDNLTEIAVTYKTVTKQSGSAFSCGGPGVATVLATGSTFNATANDWPMLNQNPHNTSVRLSKLSATVTPLTSLPNPSVFGQAVSLSMSVTSSTSTPLVPTGTVTVSEGTTTLNSCTLSSASCSVQLTGLSAGTHNLSVTYSGDANFTKVLNTLSQVVVPAATHVTLASSVNPSVVGQQVVFTASVGAIAPGSGTPTGTVTFYGDSAGIASGTVNGAGQATITVSNLTQGTHLITAIYSGDGNFGASTAMALSQVVNAGGFTMSVSAPKTVNAGQSATYTISVAPDPAPYPVAVTGFACSGLPSYTSCVFNPTSVTPGSSTATVDLTITTTARNYAVLQPSGSRFSSFALWLGMGLIGLLVLPKTRQGSKKSLCILALLACAALSSCGGGGGSTPPPPPVHTGTPAGTYTITVSAAAGTLNKNTTLTLTVN